MTNMLRELAATLLKMFVADFWLTATVLAVVGLCAVGRYAHILPPSVLPFALATGVLVALGLSVASAARR